MKNDPSARMDHKEIIFARLLTFYSKPADKSNGGCNGNN